MSNYLKSLTFKQKVNDVERRDVVVYNQDAIVQGNIVMPKVSARDRKLAGRLNLETLFDAIYLKTNGS